MTTVKYTTPAAASEEVHRRAVALVSKTDSYKDAVRITLNADPALAKAYAAPAARVKPDKRSQPAVPVSSADAREVFDWVTRAVRDGMAASLPGALGALAIEASKYVKIGMGIEEAAKRAADEHPHLMTMAKLLLTDIRRNEPKTTPAPEEKAELAQPKPGDIVHQRATALQEKHGHLDYNEAIGCVLSEDPALKTAYARS
jgi:hypothetical protein